MLAACTGSAARELNTLCEPPCEPSTHTLLDKLSSSLCPPNTGLLCQATSTHSHVSRGQPKPVYALLRPGEHQHVATHYTGSKHPGPIHQQQHYYCSGCTPASIPHLHPFFFNNVAQLSVIPSPALPTAHSLFEAFGAHHQCAAGHLSAAFSSINSFTIASSHTPAVSCCPLLPAPG